MDASIYENNSQEEPENSIYKISNFSFNLLKHNNYIKQKNLINYPDYISKKDEKYINKQMKYCICKIKCDEHFGTGFFCKINDYPINQNILSVLITSNNILGKKEISYGKYIYLSTDDESYSKSIKIDDSRLTYIDKIYNITIIELKKEDDLDVCGLEIDSELYKSESLKKYVQKTVYLIYYSDSIYSESSFGIIKSISLDNYNIKHTCKNGLGALGCPILNIQNFKLIGILKENNCFSGTLIIGPIHKFNSIHKFKKNAFLLKTVKERENEEQIEIIEENDKCVLIQYGEFNSYGILCSGNSIFADIEKIFYIKFPEFYGTNNIFLRDGKKIEKNLTVDENKCGDGFPIRFIQTNENSDYYYI